MITEFKTESGAKFAREALAKPTDWVIMPVRGGFKLVRIVACPSTVYPPVSLKVVQ